MSDRVTFSAVPSGHGGASGVLALPPGSDVVPGIVVLQEFWGLNAHIVSVAERWADAGFVVVAPDLYRGALTTDLEEASRFMDSLNRPRAIADIAGAVQYLRAHPRCTGKIGVVGFCLGGAFAFAAAAAGIEGLAAAVPFYGVPSSADWSMVTAPIQAHFSATDAWARPELAKQIQATLQAAGKLMEVFIYDAPHAFFNDTRPVYSPEHAAMAWQRSLAFMHQHLGQ
jgi:carboxymethylenebutenolidase